LAPPDSSCLPNFAPAGTDSSPPPCCDRGCTPPPASPATFSLRNLPRRWSCEFPSLVFCLLQMLLACVACHDKSREFRRSPHIARTFLHECKLVPAKAAHSARETRLP